MSVASASIGHDRDQVGVGTMTEPTFELRLEKLAEPPGEVRLSSLAGLASTLQELETRIGRHLAQQRGPGRTPRVIEELTELRLVMLAEGSARLGVRRGVDSTLDLDLEIGREIDAHFEEVVSGISAAQRPAWANPLIADTAGRLIEALQRSAPEAVFVFPGGREVALDTTAVDRSVWREPSASRTTTLVVVGLLEAVDLQSHRFRVRDDAGNGIPLNNVVGAAEAAGLVGRRVRATGTVVSEPSGKVKRLDEAVVATSALPASWTALRGPSLSELLRSSLGPDPDGGIDMSDDEFDDFLAAVHG